jgi:hypothetical protein
VSGGLTVAGGTAGIEATTEDLLLAARLVDRLGEEVRTALSSGLPSMWWFGPWDQFTPFGAEVTAVYHAILAPSAAGASAVARCQDLRTKLVAAAARYQHADDATAADVLAMGVLAGPGALTAGRSIVGGLMHLVGTRDLAGSLQQIVTGDPALVDAAMVGSGALALDVLLAPVYPDGSPVVTDTGAVAGAGAPRSVADLVTRLAARDAASTTGGAIDVTLVTGADGTRRAIVDIPGTKSWDPAESTDVTSLATNARALVGEPTTYAAGVLLALRRAGVHADEPVLLAGHSQGGMVAVEVAAIAHRTGEFDVTHVLTAGSPIGRTVGALPASVEVLALENSTDVVPHLDAAANPDRRNVTTVGFRAGNGTILGDHALEPDYEDGARLVDISRAPSLRNFEDSIARFLQGGPAVTHTYTVSRRR